MGKISLFPSLQKEKLSDGSRLFLAVLVSFPYAFCFSTFSYLTIVDNVTLKFTNTSPTISVFRTTISP